VVACGLPEAADVGAIARTVWVTRILGADGRARVCRRQTKEEVSREDCTSTALVCAADIIASTVSERWS
jgi:hypothetical protein